MMAGSSAPSQRVFLAVELSGDLNRKLASFQNHLKGILPHIHWVNPESIHLTLKFLGLVGEKTVENILTSLEPVLKRQSSLRLEIQGLGGFPQLRHPRILWVGCTGDLSGLLNMVADIESALDSLGFPIENKPYHPHLTLARIKHDNSKVGAILIRSGILEQFHHLGTLDIKRVTLFRSDLGAGGAKYTPLWSAPLNETESDSSTSR